MKLKSVFDEFQKYVESFTNGEYGEIDARRQSMANSSKRITRYSFRAYIMDVTNEGKIQYIKYNYPNMTWP